jgi:enterochelin esterase-like enzyme
MRILFSITARAVMASLLWLCTATSVPASQLVALEFQSSTLKRKWTYLVYLPDGYENSRLSYTVVYLLHGHAGLAMDWATLGHIQPTMDTLIDKLEVPPAILVMPEAGSSWYVDRKEPMERAVIEDLLPEVERTFRTVSSRDGRLIAGLSMGGYGALRFVMKYPDKFAAAGLLAPAIYEIQPPEQSTARRAGVFGASDFDPAVWTQMNYPALWDAYLAKKTPVPMFILAGDDDELFIEMESAKLYSLLRRQRQPAELRIVDGTHSWAIAEKHSADMLRYLFRFASRPRLTDPTAVNQSAKKK